MTAKIAVTFNDIKVVDYEQHLVQIWQSNSSRDWSGIYSKELTLRFWDDHYVSKQRKYEDEEVKAR